MNKKILKYTGLILFVVLTFSCEEFLDKSPALESTNELALSTFEGLEAATNGAYSPLYSSSYYGRDFLVTCDLKGGNCKASPINTGRFRYDFTWTNNDSYTSFMWQRAYQTITRASNVLEYAELLEDPDVNELDLDQLKGECLFLRALAHFDLVRMYAQPYSSSPQSLGVPIITKTELKYPSRSTVAEVYEQIVSDLEDAIGLLSAQGRNTGGKGSAAGFANKNSARALLAKVFLYMEKWQDAADFAADVIQAGYVLYDTSNYLTSWGLNNQTEVIFEVVGKDGQEFFPQFDDIGNIYDPNGYGDVCTTDDLMNLFEVGDIRSELFKTHADYPGYNWTNKYPGKSHTRENNSPVLRLSEMYLIRAEAALNGATGYDALSDYNILRINRGLANATTVNLQDIYDERRRELCFEGNQLWDLSRTGRGLDRDESEIKITETDNIDIPFPDYRWAMPIPAQEIFVNVNLKQNPNY